MKNMSGKKVKIYNTMSDRVFMGVVWVYLLIVLLVMLIPIVHIISASFSSVKAVGAGIVFIWPVDLSLESYKAIFESKDLVRSFGNSIAYTTVGTVVSVSMTFLAGYPLSRKDLKIRKGIILLYTVTMFFGGGMIPTYLIVNKLGIVNTFWAMIIPSAMGVWNVFIVKAYMQSSIPADIFESASLDGCSDWNYFLRIALPLSKSIIAVMVLMYAVAKWNDVMTGIIYLDGIEKQPFQYQLRRILLLEEMTDMISQLRQEELKNLLQYSLIVVASVPVMLLYPFIQKHFVKGVMLGSIKG